MESTSEVVLEESKTSVSSKRVQEVSASIQQLSSSSSLREQSLSSLADSSIINSGQLGTGSVVSGVTDMMAAPLAISTSLVAPIISNTPQGNVNTSSLESELIAMKLVDDTGKEIGEMVQQKQQQKSSMASSSISTTPDGSKSASSVLQQASSTVVAAAQETKSSSTSSSTASQKSVEDEKQQEAEKQVETTLTLKKGEKVVEDDTDNYGGETKKVEETVNGNDTTSAKQDKSEEAVEEEEEVVEEESDSDSVEQKVVEEDVDTPDGSTTTTVTTIKELSKPSGTTTTKTVTTTKVSQEETPQTQATTTTVITTTPPTPTTEETKTLSTETKSELPAPNVEEDLEEEEVEEEEEEDSEEEDGKEEVSTKSVPQQQLQKDQISQAAAPKQAAILKEENVTDAPAKVPTIINEPQIPGPTKQDNLNNTIKDIISSIDSNIIAEENIAALKQRELELLKKQQELAMEIQQQQLLAQKLATENQLRQQSQLSSRTQPQTIFAQQTQPQTIFTQQTQPISNVTKYSTYEEERQDENNFTRKSETVETRESTNVSKKIDLHKIFTPATDAEEILPKNRKLYASSAFYSPTLHPTVEDQVELARKISHSLSDITNQQSKGQSMYVNRKKRSVKWVHEGCGQENVGDTSTTSSESQNVTTDQAEFVEDSKENDDGHVVHYDKVPLKFLMNPYGQMRDINSLRESLNTETGLLSPDTTAEVVTALQTQKGKGAELFAKRRKVSEKWVVDESNVGSQSPSGLPDYHQYQQQPKPPTSPSILPAYTDAAKHRVQLNIHQEKLLEKYAKPGLKVVKTPWEAALESGSASAAFVEEQKLSAYPTQTRSPAPQYFDASQGGMSYEPDSVTTKANSYNKPYSSERYQEYTTQPQPQHKLPQAHYESRQPAVINPQRDLAYKPSIPQGWRAPSMSLPKDLLEYEQQQQQHTSFTQVLEQAAREMERIQQQQQHITVINEAARTCESFNTKDEAEIIDLVKDVKVSTFTSTANASIVAKNTLSTQMHEFVNHLIKSPELRLSPIPIETQVIYDNTVQELQEKQQHGNNQRIVEKGKLEEKELRRETETIVNVRKQLQQYEDLHQQHAERQRNEELIRKKREEQQLIKKNEKAQGSRQQQISCDNSTTSRSNKSTNWQNTNSATQIEPVDEYVKVPVRELIINFEQQSQQEEQKHPPSSHQKTNHIMEFEQPCSSGRQLDMQEITEDNEDLYVPKEIPLQSYAPPPVAAIPPTAANSMNTAYDSYESSWKPSMQSQHTYQQQASPTAASFATPVQTSSVPFSGNSTFPLVKPTQVGFSTTYGSNNQPPKQQYLPPQSYQTVLQTTTQNVPQVNFNPSPLPYDKLAKFENPSVDSFNGNDSRRVYSPPRSANLNVQGGRVRNTSPAPFGTSPYQQQQRPYTPSYESNSFAGTPSISPRPSSTLQQQQQYSGNITPTQQVTNFNSNQLLHAPTYNSSARGWRCTGPSSTGYQALLHQQQRPMTNPKPHMVSAGSMPYTDF